MDEEKRGDPSIRQIVEELTKVSMAIQQQQAQITKLAQAQARQVVVAPSPLSLPRSTSQSHSHASDEGSASHQRLPVKIGTFSGKKEENVAVWLFQLNNALDALKIQEGSVRIRCAASKFTGNALLWWFSREPFCVTNCYNLPPHRRRCRSMTSFHSSEPWFEGGTSEGSGDQSSHNAQRCCQPCAEM